MTYSPRYQADTLQDRLGFKLAARLSEGTSALPHDISERLRAARVQAVSQRKRVRLQAAPAVVSAGNGAALLLGDEGPGIWGRMAAFLPLVALVAGLLLIDTIQNESRAQEVAEVDAALLTDDLPPSAYTDPGFMQFLKSSREQEQ